LNVSPPESKAVHNNVFNVAIDTGHTWLVVSDNDNNTTTTWSFGPGAQIGRGNKNQFKDGKLPGNANWPTQGDVVGATKTWELDREHCDRAKKLIEDKKASVPNYTPTYQCTSSALDILNAIHLDPPPPAGVGHVIARAYGHTFWEGDIANPYNLSVALGVYQTGGESSKKQK
jgi:hypothetical protein